MLIILLFMTKPPRKNVLDVGIELGACQANSLPIELPRPVHVKVIVIERNNRESSMITLTNMNNDLLTCMMKYFHSVEINLV